MKLKVFKVLLGILVVVMFLAAYREIWLLRNRITISQLPAKISEPILSNIGLKELTPETVRDIHEIARFSTPKNKSAVLKITQVGNDILAVYSDGTLQRWNIISENLEDAYALGDITRTSLNFSEDGSLLITSGPMTLDGINGYNLWRTDNGESIECFGPQCPDGGNVGVASGFYLSPTGNFVVGYYFQSISFSGRKKYFDTETLNFLTDEFQKPINITRVLIDPSDRYLAMTSENGDTYVVPLEKYLGVDPNSTFQYSATGTALENFLKYGNSIIPKKTNIVTLLFDDTCTWLVRLTDKEMTTWNLQRYISPVQLSEHVSDGNDVAIDHSGKLLILSTRNGFLVYDLFLGKRIKFFEEGNVTSVYFSRDNRLLIWGDVNGIVHLWAVR